MSRARVPPPRANSIKRPGVKGLSRLLLAPAPMRRRCANPKMLRLHLSSPRGIRRDKSVWARERRFKPIGAAPPLSPRPPRSGRASAKSRRVKPFAIKSRIGFASLRQPMKMKKYTDETGIFSASSPKAPYKIIKSSGIIMLCATSLQKITKVERTIIHPLITPHQRVYTLMRKK